VLVDDGWHSQGLREKRVHWQPLCFGSGCVRSQQGNSNDLQYIRLYTAMYGYVRLYTAIYGSGFLIEASQNNPYWELKKLLVT
jgi:hypothetical protein